MKLTEKQKRFADYYIETGNATESAIRAGYSKKTAKAIGAENLTKPYLKSYIDQRLAELASERVASQQEILEYLTAIARNEETEEVVLPGELGIERVRKSISAKDRLKALELLGKRFAMFTDRQQVDVQGAVQIVDDVPSAGDS